MKADKIFVLICLILLSVILLLSCGRSPKTGENEKSTLIGDTAESPETDAGEKMNINDYLLVLSKDSTECENDCAESIARHIDTVCGGKVKVINETERVYSADSYEILIGDVTCPEVKALKSELALNEYGIFKRGKKIILFGRSLADTVKSEEAFLLLLKKSTALTDSGFSLDLKLDDDVKLIRDDLTVDFPQFRDKAPDGSYELSDRALAIFYSRVPSDEAERYYDTLLKSGYSLYSTNKIGKYSFSVYRRSGTALYLMYGADGSFRIITAPDDGIIPVAIEAGEQITELSLTQMSLDYSTSDVGMSYIITLPDGRFVIVDGGHILSSEARGLLDKMHELNKRDGRPVIAAWILTHTHNDHFGVFKKFSDELADTVTVERVIANLPSEYSYYKTNHNSFFYPEINEAVKKFSEQPELIIPQTGDKMTVGDIEFEFIYTHVDFYPNALNVFNNSSTVFRMTAKGQTVLFLGDIETEGANVIEKMYGSFLKSDIVQAAHHGYSNGGSKELYKSIDPSVVLWSSSEKLFESRKSVSVGAYLLNSLQVKETVCSFKGSRTIVLPYSVGK